MKQKCYLLSNGDGPELEASIKTTKSVFNSLIDKYDVENLVLNKNNWIGKVMDIPKTSFCFLATHGGFGEDGTLQEMLELNDLAHTHSMAKVCNILSDKHQSKLKFRSLGIPTASWYYEGKFYRGGEVFNSTVLPCWVKKPLRGGSKVGIKKTGSVDVYDGTSIFENYIDGDLEISIAVFRDNEKIISLTPYIRKRILFNISSGKNDLSINNKILAQCVHAAETVYSSLSCNGVIKADFLVDKEYQVWMIEVDAIPGLARDNATAISAERSGILYDDFIINIINDLYVR